MYIYIIKIKAMDPHLYETIYIISVRASEEKFWSGFSEQKAKRDKNGAKNKNNNDNILLRASKASEEKILVCISELKARTE